MSSNSDNRVGNQVLFLISGDETFSDLVIRSTQNLPDICINPLPDRPGYGGPMVILVQDAKDKNHGVLSYENNPLLVRAIIDLSGNKKPGYENGWYHLPLQQGENLLLMGNYCRLLAILARQTLGIAGEPAFVYDHSNRLVMEGSVVEAALSIGKTGIWGYEPEEMIFLFSQNSRKIIGELTNSSSAGFLIHPSDRAGFFLALFEVFSGYERDMNVSFGVIQENEKIIRCRMTGSLTKIRDGFSFSGIITRSGSDGVNDRPSGLICQEGNNQYVTDLLFQNRLLVSSREKLEQRIYNLNMEVQRRTHDIDEILQEKDRLISEIGHDLKTPLTPLIGILPVVRKKINNEKLASYLDVAIRNAHQMQELLIKILQMDHLNERYLSLFGIPLSIHDMFEELIINFQYDILKKRLSVENRVPEEMKVRFNPVEFDTIFEELLHNAIRFSYPKGTIYLEAESRDRSLIIRVRDTGPGLSHEDRIRIFDKFYMVDPSRHDGRSHGLGLAITRQIVEQNGGKIDVSSQGPGKGTCFTICFPNR